MHKWRKKFLSTAIFIGNTFLIKIYFSLERYLFRVAYVNLFFLFSFFQIGILKLCSEGLISIIIFCILWRGFLQKIDCYKLPWALCFLGGWSKEPISVMWATLPGCIWKFWWTLYLGIILKMLAFLFVPLVMKFSHSHGN